MSPSRARLDAATSPAPAESEILLLRRLALEAAGARKERPTTVHLCAVLCSRDGAAAELLAARRLDEAGLLKAGRTFDERLSDPIGRALSAARVLCRRASVPAPRSGQRGASAIHVLVALLSDRDFAAYRALAQCGVDLGRLRAEAIERAHGRASAGHSEPVAPVPVPLRPGIRPAALRPARTWGAREGGDRRPVAVPMTSLGVPKPGPAELAATATASAPSSTPPAAQPAASTAIAVPLAEIARLRVEPRTPGAPSRAGRRPLRDADLSLDPTTFPTLTALGRNLTLAAALGELDPVVAREAEIERALDVLAKRHAHNPLLVGTAGAGKTCVARGLAARLAAEGSRLLIELSPAALLAGTANRGALAERLAAIAAEVVRSEGRVVAFVDDIDELIAGGADEVIGELKTALGAGMHLVAATSPAGHRRSIEGDAALARRFSVVDVDEPDEARALAMLKVAADGLSTHHAVSIASEAVESVVAWSARYLTGRALPDKAIAALDLAAARVRRAAGREPPRGKSRRLTVGRSDVATIVAEMSGVPAERLLETDGDRMLRLEQELGRRVVGHEPTLERIARILRRNAAGLRGSRPIGSFLLLGPTGVGKTETAKAIAQALFHSPDAMTRLDMSEYAEPHALARLIGAPPGYIGHEAGGALTEAVRRRPYQVVLLDEIEKAHRDVLETFLQVLDEGRLTDGRGRTVDFRSTVVVLTSNLGAGQMRDARNARRVGFGTSRAEPGDADRLGRIALDAARAALPPELYNRFDEVLVYRPLERTQVERIAELLLADLASTLRERGIALDVASGVVAALCDAGGFDPELGARPMRRTIARLVEAPLAELILSRDLARGSTAAVGLATDGRLVVVAR